MAVKGLGLVPTLLAYLVRRLLEELPDARAAEVVDEVYELFLDLDADEAQALVPFVTDGVYRCTYGPADGYIDPVAVLRAYLKLAQERGAHLRLGAPVTAVKRLRDGWRLATPKGSVTAGVVVNAAGAWAGEVARLAWQTGAVVLCTFVSPFAACWPVAIC